MARGDDDFLQVNLPFTINWFGTNYTKVYINQNGSVTLNNSMGTPYNPTGALSTLNRDVIAPFMADVDTRIAAQITYNGTVSPPQVNGRNAFFVNWVGVGYHNSHTTPTDSYQLVIVDHAGRGARVRYPRLGDGNATPPHPQGTPRRQSVGSPYVCTHDYIVDLALDAPWTNEPGLYATMITYTLVQK
jgi:hypothetical protein